MAGVANMISVITARPVPSARGHSAWVTTPCSAVDNWARICCCWCGGKMSMTRSMVCAATLGVQRGQYEVAGFGGGECGGGRLQVTQLADQDDVGVLAERVFERGGERLGVLADLALVHQAALVLVQELDRVLDRHDVRRARPVGQVEQRRERRRLTRSGRSGDQHEATRQVCEPGHRLGHAEFVERLDVERDGPERGAIGRALLVQVHPEATEALDAVGQVEFMGVLEVLPLLGGDDRAQQHRGVDGGQLVVSRQGVQTAVHAHRGRRSGGDVQVGAAGLDDDAQHCVQPCALLGEVLGRGRRGEGL